jgi:replicative DNA helicase
MEYSKSKSSAPSVDLAFERGLPADPEVERFLLGAILSDETYFAHIGGAIQVEDFSLEKHRKIFGRMVELAERRERIDRVTLANELMKNGQLESVDGLSYLVSLDEGLPAVFNIMSFVNILREKSILRQIIFASQKMIDRCLTGNEDPLQILSGAEESLLKLGETQISDTFSNPGQIIAEVEGGINVFLDPSRRIKGLSTGFLKFDEMTAGMHGGELIILAARPSMGKTALALNIAQHVATNPHDPRTVAIFSLEMSKESLLTRMICAAGRVDQQKFRAGYLNAEERRRLHVAAQQMVESPLFIDDTAGVSLLDVQSKLRRLQAKHGLGMVVIDYLQLMTGRGKSENRNQEVSVISRGLKLLAKELNVPFLVLSQLSRAPEQRPGDPVPMLSDLRDSGSIEQDADLVMFIYREEVYKPDREDLKGLAQIVLAKQRNGPIGRINLVFLKECTKFENPIKDIDGDTGE